MNFIDLIILIVLAVTIYTEARRGFLIVLLDILRVIIALVIGGLGYFIGARIFHNLEIGLFLFLFLALATVFIIPRIFKILPSQKEPLVSKIFGGLLGFVLGIFICLGVILIIAIIPTFRDDVDQSILSQPILSIIPAIHYEADVLNLRMPSMGSTALNFDEEGNTVVQRHVLKERVNFLRLDNSTCIECGAKVNFVGYKRRGGLLVSPLFVCPNCGRTSDGCQTFEGFHKIYGHCPIEIVEKSGPIDCGVWNNHRPVYPKGVCPVCGKSLDESKFRIRIYDD
jgi:hypothetical protein